MIQQNQDEKVKSSLGHYFGPINIDKISVKVMVTVSSVFSVFVFLFLVYTSFRFFYKIFRGKKRTVFKNIIAFYVIIACTALVGLVSSVNMIVLCWSNAFISHQLHKCIYVLITFLFVLGTFRPYYIWLYILRFKKLVYLFAVGECFITAAMTANIIIAMVVAPDWSLENRLQFAVGNVGAFSGIFFLFGMLYWVLGFGVYRRLISMGPMEGQASNGKDRGVKWYTWRWNTVSLNKCPPNWDCCEDDGYGTEGDTPPPDQEKEHQGDSSMTNPDDNNSNNHEFNHSTDSNNNNNNNNNNKNDNTNNNTNESNQLTQETNEKEHLLDKYKNALSDDSNIGSIDYYSSANKSKPKRTLKSASASVQQTSRKIRNMSIAMGIYMISLSILFLFAGIGIRMMMQDGLNSSWAIAVDIVFATSTFAALLSAVAVSVILSGH